MYIKYTNEKNIKTKYTIVKIKFNMYNYFHYFIIFINIYIK